MLKTTVLLLIAALCAPLYAGGQMQGVFERKVADDWYKHFQSWVAAECTSGRFPETWFSIDQGEPRPYRIRAVSNGRLDCVELVGELRQPADKGTTFDWQDWKPELIAGVYPVKTNDDSQDLVAFAAWLYLHADNPMIANRVLTVVYERDEAIQEAIAEYVRSKHELDEKEKLAVGEQWDSQFQKWRRVLVSRKDAKKLADARKEEGENGARNLIAEYDNPESRIHTLAEIDFLLRQWQLKFEGTKYFEKQNPDVTKTRTAIKEDERKIEAFESLAAGAADLKERAEQYENALQLDPCSALLLSKAANTWKEHANPEVVNGRFKCTQEHSARRAIELYERWLKRDADNFGVLLNLGVCHHVVGERGDATDCYKRVIKESSDDELVKLAKNYDRIP
ncbi:MAG: hypothetical protein KDB82_01760 [Planctomycetes bacterium]|nr:hypothetical protein [Planctomycetota bacterium]